MVQKSEFVSPGEVVKIFMIMSEFGGGLTRGSFLKSIFNQFSHMTHHIPKAAA